MGYCISDAVFVEILLYLDGPDLYAMREAGNELLQNKHVIQLLCARHQFPLKATFEEFLLEWNYWYLDRDDIPYEVLRRALT